MSFDNTKAIDSAVVRLHDVPGITPGTVTISALDYFAADDDDMEDFRRRLEETFGALYDCEATVVFDFETGE